MQRDVAASTDWAVGHLGTRAGGEIEASRSVPCRSLTPPLAPSRQRVPGHGQAMLTFLTLTEGHPEDLPATQATNQTASVSRRSSGSVRNASNRGGGQRKPRSRKSGGGSGLTPSHGVNEWASVRPQRRVNTNTAGCG